jgi:hypothetical protein
MSSEAEFSWENREKEGLGWDPTRALASPARAEVTP